VKCWLKRPSSATRRSQKSWSSEVTTRYLMSSVSHIGNPSFVLATTYGSPHPRGRQKGTFRVVIPLPRAFLCKARGALGEGTSSPNVSVGDGNPVLVRRMDSRLRGSDGVVACLEMQKAPGCPGAFVLLCFYRLYSRETMQLGELGARR